MSLFRGVSLSTVARSERERRRSGSDVPRAVWRDTDETRRSGYSGILLGAARSSCYLSDTELRLEHDDR